MRILYVTNGFPYPLTSGYLRHYFLIRELSERHAITLASIVGADFSRDHAEALVPLTERVLTFPAAGRSRRERVASRAVRAVGGSEGAARRLGERVAALARDEPFDAVLFSGKRTYPALPLLAHLPVVVDVCDTASARIRGSIAFAPLRKRPALAVACAEAARIERRLAAAASRLLFASNRDRDLFLERAGPAGRELRTAVVPNGVDLAYWSRQSTRLGRDTIAFTGKMSYAPNEDAALFLIEEIMPRVRASIPEARLLVVGRDPAKRLLAAVPSPGLTVTGHVDDVRPYLEQAAVFAAPIRFGAGIQNKVLEAMAMEVPVVASPIAAGGLQADGETPPVEIAAEPGVFAARVVERLRLARERGTTDRAARDFVGRRFVWELSARAVEDALNEAGARARPARADAVRR